MNREKKNTDFNNLPINWSWVKLGDVCNKITDGTHNSPKSTLNGLPYVTVKDINNDKIDFENCKRITEKDFDFFSRNDCAPQINDVLLSKDGTVGKVSIVDFERKFIILSSIAILRPKLERLFPKYIFYYLKSNNFLQQALKIKKGVAIRRIILRDIKNLDIAIAPISVQQKIVSKIEELFSELDSGVASLKKAKEQIKTYRQAVLASAFSGRLNRLNLDLVDSKINRIKAQDESGESDNPVNQGSDNFPVELEERLNGIQEVGAAAEMKEKYGLNLDSPDSKINRIKTQDESDKSGNHVNPGSDNFPGELPEGWRSVKLGEVTHINPKLPFANIPNETMVTFLPMKMVKELSGEYDLTEERKYSEVKKGFTPFTNGDVIFAKITPCMENGKIAVLNNLKNKIGFGSTEFHVFRTKEELNNQYLFYFLIQESFRGEAQHNMTGAVGQKRVPRIFLENSIVPLPPIKEQFTIVKEIEKRFSEADNLEKAIDESLAKAETLRQSILKQAFEGRLVNEE